jgi:hypothetical protein
MGNPGERTDRSLEDLGTADASSSRCAKCYANRSIVFAAGSTLIVVIRGPAKNRASI